MADQTHPTPEAVRATDPRTLAADDDPKACLRDCRVTDDNYPAPCFTHPDVVHPGCSRQRATRATVAADGPRAEIVAGIDRVLNVVADGWGLTADDAKLLAGEVLWLRATRPEPPSGRVTGREGGTEGDA